jgi:Xaa-Pro aminopeptidase
MRQTLESRGITASFPHGHGIGLELREYPIIVDDNGLRIKDDCVDVPSDIPLEADMVVNLESSVFMGGVGSLHIEKTYAITTNGCRPIVPQDRSKPVVPSSGTTIRSGSSRSRQKFTAS